MTNIRDKDSIRTFSKDAALVESKRDEIINKATRVFLRKGYHKTNMREIAAECNMSIGSIYNYFGSKQDILFLLIETISKWPDEFILQLDELLDEKGPEEVLKLFIDMYYRICDKTRANLLFIYRETMNLEKDFRHTVVETSIMDIEICKRILNRGIETGVFKIDNPSLIAHNIIVLSHMWAVRGYLLKDICTIDDYILEQTAIVLNRIKVKPETG